MARSHHLMGLANKVLLDVSKHDAHDARQVAAKYMDLAIKAEALDNMARKRNPMTTPEAHYKKVAEASRKFGETSGNELNKIRDYYKSRREQLMNTVDIKSELRQTPNSAEIRAAFRSLTPDQRSEAINNALRNSNSEVIAAITDGPEFMTGVKEDFYGRYRDVIREKKAEAELNDIKVFDDAYSPIRSVENLVRDITNEYSDSKKLQDIEAGEKASLEAENSFNQSFSEA